MLRHLIAIVLLGFSSFATSQDFEPEVAVPARRCVGMCGCFRWAVKTGVGVPVAAKRVQTTIAELASVPIPAALKGAKGDGGAFFAKRVGPELKVFALESVKIREIRREADQDLHVVLQDERAHTMVAEVPHPECIVESAHSVIRDYIRRTRSRLLCRYPALRNAGKRKVTGDDTTLAVSGAGFFDFQHLSGNRPVGMLHNVLELHPLLAIKFTDGKCNVSR